MDPAVNLEAFPRGMAFAADGAHERLQVAVPLVLSVESESAEHAATPPVRTEVLFECTRPLRIDPAAMVATVLFMGIETVFVGEHAAAFVADPDGIGMAANGSVCGELVFGDGLPAPTCDGGLESVEFTRGATASALRSGYSENVRGRDTSRTRRGANC